jgi:hypothetical protein
LSTAVENVYNRETLGPHTRRFLLIMGKVDFVEPGGEVLARVKGVAF